MSEIFCQILLKSANLYSSCNQ